MLILHYCYLQICLC